MKPIVAPIKPNETGPNVANLIECLLFLVEHGVFKTRRAPDRPTPDELEGLAAKAKEEFSAQLFGEASRALVLYFQIQQGLGDNRLGVVDDETAAALNQCLKQNGAVFEEPDLWIVEGRVLRVEAPAPGATVVVFDRDLRTLQPLGKAMTGDAGQYRVVFQTADFQRADRPRRPSPWLIVQAVADWAPTVTVERRDASRHEIIDVQLGDAGVETSEWQRIAAAVIPLLEGQGEADTPLGVAQIVPYGADLEFLAHESGIAPERIAQWVRACQLAESLRPKEPPPDWPGAALWLFFFGEALLSGRPDLDAVLRQTAAQWRETLTWAIAGRKVPPIEPGQQDAVVDVLDLLQRRRETDSIAPDASPYARVLRIARSRADIGETVALAGWTSTGRRASRT